MTNSVRIQKGRTAKQSHATNYDISRKYGQIIVRRDEKIFFTDLPNAKVLLKPKHDENQVSNVDSNVTGETEEYYYSKNTYFFQIPNNATPGKYCLEINGQIQEPNVYIIFNPWSQNCPEFLENSAELDGFLLADTGFISQGSGFGGRAIGINWFFNQFDGNILDDVFEFMKNYKNTVSNPEYSLNHPVDFSRAVSSVVNTHVLRGRWDGDYKDGISPGRWKSSAEIIKRALKNKKCTKYGQCWVFSAVCVTFLRAVGLPCRSCTCESSAHDHGKNLMVEEFVDVNHKKIVDGESFGKNGNDSIWNFHVWNEVWFSWEGSRTKLDGKYEHGWNVIDATPQELSSGVYQLGPAPISAIRSGNVDDGFDTDFVFTEVNGDKVTYLVDGSKKLKEISRDTRAVGRAVWSATAAQPSKVENLLYNYKPFESSQDAIEVMKNAFKSLSKIGGNSGFFVEDPCSDPVYDHIKSKVDIDVNSFDEIFGKTMNFKASISKPNRLDNDDTHYNYQWRVDSVKSIDSGAIHDHGLVAWDGAYFEKEEFFGEPAEQPTNIEILQIEIDAKKYLPKIMGNLAYKLQVFLCENSDGKDEVLAYDTHVFTLDLPKNLIHSVGYKNDGYRNVIFGVFDNRLPLALTDCQISVQSQSGVMREVRVKPIRKGECITFEIPYEFLSSGKKMVTVTVDSAEIPDISESFGLDVVFEVEDNCFDDKESEEENGIVNTVGRDSRIVDTGSSDIRSDLNDRIRFFENL